MRTPQPTTLTKGGSASGATSYATASVTPIAGRLYLAAFATRTGITANPNQPTASGAGLTWTVPSNGSVVYDDTSSSRKRITLLQAYASSPSTGAVTFDEGGQTQTNAEWIIIEVPSGFDTQNPIVQTVNNKDGTATASTITATLAAFSHNDNATLGFFAEGNGSTWTVGSGFSSIDTQNSSATISLLVEFKNTNDTTVDATDGVNSELGVIAIELRALVVPTRNTFANQAVNRASTY